MMSRLYKISVPTLILAAATFAAFSQNLVAQDNAPAVQQDNTFQTLHLMKRSFAPPAGEEEFAALPRGEMMMRRSDLSDFNTQLQDLAASWKEGKSTAHMLDCRLATDSTPVLTSAESVCSSKDYRSGNSSAVCFMKTYCTLGTFNQDSFLPGNSKIPLKRLSASRGPSEGFDGVAICRGKTGMHHPDTNDATDSCPQPNDCVRDTLIKTSMARLNRDLRTRSTGNGLDEGSDTSNGQPAK